MLTITVVVPGPAAGLFQLALEPFCVAVAAEVAASVGGSDWRVTGYAEAMPDVDALEQALAIAAAGAGIAPPRPMAAALPETDWLAENRRSFPSVRVGRFYIHRSHHDRAPADGRIAIRLDASLAFGSGTHASTQGCLIALDTLAPRIRPRHVLDLGTGSGILAVAAAKLWPARIVATDIDPASVRMTRENARVNGVSARLAAVEGPGTRPVPRGSRFDLVLANIQVRPLAAMAPAVARRIRPGGYVVLSGLLRGDEAEALSAYRAPGLALAARIPLGDWVTLVLQRRANRGSVTCRGRRRA